MDIEKPYEPSSAHVPDLKHAVENLPQKQVLFIIDHLPIRVKKICELFGEFYELRVFTDGEKALDAMRQNPPTAVISDDHALQSHGHGVHRTKCLSNDLKHIPFFVTSDELNGPYIMGDGSGATDYFLKRPVKVNQLFDLVTKVTNTQIETAWGNALQHTSDGFDRIVKAVANNIPLEKSQMTASCNPLIDCVQNNQQKDILQGLKNHHSFIYAHSLRVAIFMCAFAKAYDVSKDELIEMTTGGFMHDVGEIMIPIALLNKTGKLTEPEIITMHHHVEESEHIISSIHNVSPVIEAIAELHHERLDGSGYPHGLKGAKINELGRMIAIADIFAALTDARPYRNAIDAHAAFSKMEEMGATIDLPLLHLFRDVVTH